MSYHTLLSAETQPQVAEHDWSTSKESRAKKANLHFAHEVLINRVEVCGFACGVFVVEGLARVVLQAKDTRELVTARPRPATLPTNWFTKPDVSLGLGKGELKRRAGKASWKGELKALAHK